MSDQSKDNPPSKLKLSCDLQAPEGPRSEQTPPAIKLRLSKLTEEPPPGSATPSLSVRDEPVEKATFDPVNPLDDTIKLGEIKALHRTTPELPSEPAPQLSQGSGAKLEEAIQSLNNVSEDSPNNRLLPSILAISVLLFVLAAAAYGLWNVLTHTDKPLTDSKLDVAPAKTTASKDPIQRTKDAITAVPVATVDYVGSKSKQKDAPQVEAVPDSSAPRTTASPMESPVTIGSAESSKQSVIQYLSRIRISGVRQGERPIVIIEGQSFYVGDIVETEYGLRFDGIRDGRLAFRDSHGIIFLKSF